MVTHKKYLLFIILLAVTWLVISCGKDDESPTEPFVIDYNARLKTAQNTLAWTVFEGELASNPEGYVQTVGPANYICLGSMFISTLDDTKEQLKDLLGLGAFTDTIFMETLSEIIDSLERGATGSSFHYNLAIFCHEHSPLDTVFARRIEQFFNGRIFVVDYADSVLDDSIRWWMEETSYDEITCSDCDPEGIETAAIFATAYFDAMWPFVVDTNNNTTEVYHDPVGGDTTVDMMHVSQIMRYFENSSVQMVDMPLGNGGFRMSLVLPKDSAWPIPGSAIPEASRYSNWLAGASDTIVNLSLPPLKILNQIPLDSILTALGARSLFSSASGDWYLFADSSRQYLGSFWESTKIRFSSDGFTALSMKPTIGQNPLSSAEMVFDRPFFYVVRDDVTGTILALGRIIRPLPVSVDWGPDD